MIPEEIQQLEKRVHRLIASYRQLLLERRRAIQERDRVMTLNAELRTRIESIVERIRTLESEGSA